MEVICGDIRDADFINRTIRGCDSVFHLAALIGIPYSYDSPKTYIETNVMGTYNILEAARNHNLENVVITSTSEVYGTAQYDLLMNFTPDQRNHLMQRQKQLQTNWLSVITVHLDYQ